MHPAPGANGRPSYTAVVGNIDAHMVKYVAGKTEARGVRDSYSDDGGNTYSDSRPRLPRRNNSRFEGDGCCTPLSFILIYPCLIDCHKEILKKWLENRTEGDRKRAVKSYRLIFYRGNLIFRVCTDCLVIEM